MQELWDRFHEWLAEHAPQVLESLPPGATDDEIRLTEQTLGVTLPDDFKASYRIHNGQGKYDLAGIFYELLSLERIRREWQDNVDLADIEPAYDVPPLPPGPVRDVIWSVGWVPFTSDGAGQHHCLDFDPAESGQVGQVFFFDHEVGTELKAGSFRAWLASIVEECKAGQRVFSESQRGVIEIEFL